MQVGTIRAYPKLTPVPFREENLWNGYPEEINCPLTASPRKRLLVMLRSYRQQYGMSGIYLLPVNLYGPGDNFDPNTSCDSALIRKFCEAKEQGKDHVVVWGTGRASREFLYVTTVPGPSPWPPAYRQARSSQSRGGLRITIRDLAETIRHSAGFEGRLVWDDTKPDGQPRRFLDTSRAAAEFGCVATPFEEGLRRTIQWWECAAHEGQNRGTAKA